MSKNLFLFISDFFLSLKKWRVFLYLGKQDVRSRYQRTMLGLLWPFMTITVWVIGVGMIYGSLFEQNLSSFLPYLTLGFVLWGFISNSIVDGCSSYMSSAGYIKQFSFPSTVYVFRTFISCAFNLLITLPVAFFILVFFRIDMGIQTLWVIPGLVLVFFATFGHVLLFANLTLYFKDIPHLVGAGLQLIFFVTPIIFTVEMLKDKGLDFIYKFNPFFYLIEIVRYPLLNNRHCSIDHYLVCAAYIMAVMALAFVVATITKPKLVYKL